LGIAKTSIRKATEADFESVYPLLKELNNTRLKRQDWQQLFHNHWQLKDFSPGLLIQCQEQIVGFIATLYSPTSKDRSNQICNLSSWIVKDEYRSSSMMMLLKLLRDKNTTFTSFSSNDISYKIYQKLKFQDWEHYARVIYPFPSLKNNHYRIITSTKDFQTTLSEAEYQIYHDHQDFKCHHLVIQHKGGSYSYIISVQRGKKLKLYYASNPTFIRENISDFRWPLMKLYSAKKLYIGEKIIGARKPFFSRQKNYRHPYQIKAAKSGSFHEQQLNLLYSELLLLNM